MLEYHGLYLPDGEVHLRQWMDKKNQIVDGKPSYQFHKLTAALEWVTNWRTAIDVGAHCGLMSLHLVKRFACLHAFEPVATHRECFHMNVKGAVLHPVALGEKPDAIAMHTSP